MRFEGKHLVVVGGSSGIGLETARMALAEGASVTIAGRSEDRLRQAVESLGASPADDPAGRRLRPVVADISAARTKRRFTSIVSDPRPQAPCVVIWRKTSVGAMPGMVNQL